MNSKAGVVLGALGIGGLLAFVFTRKAKAAVYKCPVCGEEFSSAEELQAHFTTAHPREPVTIIWE